MAYLWVFLLDRLSWSLLDFLWQDAEQRRSGISDYLPKPKPIRDYLPIKRR